MLKLCKNYYLDNSLLQIIRVMKFAFVHVLYTLKFLLYSHVYYIDVHSLLFEAQR